MNKAADSNAFRLSDDTKELCGLTRVDIELDLGLVSAETWPARYKFHKYWGRKPANVVSQYINYFSRPGEVVLDPFSGSGVTVVEGCLHGRNAIGFDINSVALSMADAMLRPADVVAFSEAAKSIVDRVRRETARHYQTKCEVCFQSAEMRSAAYVGAEMKEVRYVCQSCGFKGQKKPTVEDFSAVDTLTNDFEFPDSDIAFGWEMQKLRRKGVKRWSELFTPRNLRAAALLRERIELIDNPRVRLWLLLTFTAALAQFTKMIMDAPLAGGGPSWKINCYWLPNKWQELNPVWYFSNRVSKSIRALEDLARNKISSTGRGEVRKVDSRAMPLKDDSVDYIFTDPPYGGEGIQYGELSVLWNLWMGAEQNLSDEIAFNPYRGFDQTHYAESLADVMRESFRVLREGRHMTVTFANKDPQVWKALMDACKSAGFELLVVVPMARSAPSLTQTNTATAPKTDLILTFLKPRASKRNVREARETYSLPRELARLVREASDRGLELTDHELLDRLTIDWFSWYYENEGQEHSAKPTLSAVQKARASTR